MLVLEFCYDSVVGWHFDELEEKVSIELRIELYLVELLTLQLE